MKFELMFGQFHSVPEEVWVLLAKIVGAIAGSAISIAYLLPSGRREAWLRFIVGIAIGMVFGTATGWKLADYLNVTDRMSEIEIALSGSALASLCAWWGLGVLSRIFTKPKFAK